MKQKITLKELRLILGISQKKISEIISVDQPSVSKIENGKIYGPGFVKYLEFLVSKGIDVNPLFKKNNS